MKKQQVTIIGAGFSALAASCYLSQQGFDVLILEKNAHLGGRAQQLHKDGFVFDMGPTFYWMPDVFEKFFNDFGKKTSDFYELNRLNPGYEVYFGVHDSVKIADNLADIAESFEAVDKGSGTKMKAFIKRAEDNYNIAIKDLVYQPGQNIMEIITPQTALKLGEFFGTIKGQVGQYIKNPKLRKILEFPVLFLGAKPSTTPAFYNFMNYADFVLGTWHPTGGMYAVVEGMQRLAQSLGVQIKTGVAVQKMIVKNGKVQEIVTNHGNHQADIVLSGADYHHTETLLPIESRQYSEKYWDKKTFAPSALLFYVGFDKPLQNVSHHTLFFDTDFDKHAVTIYDEKIWPKEPLFYASFPSKTDNTVAPAGKEAGIFLIPLAPDLEDTPAIRDTYFDIILGRLEKLTGQTVRENILFKDSYCVNDFKEQFNSYKGNAYGLANTLLQTHILRPRLKSKKVKNLYFTGQLTIPGPGVPPSLISGKIVSDLISKYHAHETNI